MNSDPHSLDHDHTIIEIQPDNHTYDNSHDYSTDDQESQNDEIRQELPMKRKPLNTSEKLHDHNTSTPNNDEASDKNNNDDTTQESSTQSIASSIESLDEAPIQLPNTVATSNQRSTMQVMSGRIFDLLHNVVSPNRQAILPSIPEVPEMPSPRRNPFLSMFAPSLPVFRHNRNNLRSITNGDVEQPNDNDNDTTIDNIADENESDHEQVNQNQNIYNHDDDLHNLEHGAIIVRTMSPGPDGSMIVRMRVIPFDELFGSRNANPFGDNDRHHVGLFGALVRLLASANHFNMERGLEKETLDSLPVVKYSEEAFKNVEEGSKKCSICYENYEEEQEIRYLWCIHRFHKGCIDQWLGSHSNCPICKKDYSEVEKMTYE